MASHVVRVLPDSANQASPSLMVSTQEPPSAVPQPVSANDAARHRDVTERVA